MASDASPRSNDNPSVWRSKKYFTSIERDILTRFPSFRMLDMTTRVYLVRHGATELTDEDRFAGAIDVRLSDEGREQARLLGKRLEGDPINVAFASPMTRTMDTAGLIVAPHGLEVTPVDGLR